MAQISGARLLEDLEALAAIGADPAGGITRRAFSPAFAAAADWLMARMREAGMSARMDAAGNVIGRIGRDDRPAILCGSHIDTVPNGGALDGALGVLAGLECARALGDRFRGGPLALEVVAFADEEGAFVSLFGSRAMTGLLDAAVIEGPGGAALAEAMQAAGLGLDRVTGARRKIEEIAAYLELHIEQGPVLEAAGLDVGIVEAIVGMDLVQYRLLGDARHAGSTPMHSRRDAGRGACLAVTAAFEAFERSRHRETGRMTFGQIEFAPGASNVVPGAATVTSEVRAQSPDELAALRTIVDAAFQDAADRFGLALERSDSAVDRPVPLSTRIGAISLRAAEHLAIPTMRLPSGACHDAQIFAPLVPTGMIFCASRGGISHHPDEFSAPETLVAGARVLAGTIEQLVEAAA